MKIALAMIMCTALYQECLTPHRMPETYKSYYDCFLAGYEESQKKLKEIGKQEVNKYQTFVKFVCYEVKEEKPKTNA